MLKNTELAEAVRNTAYFLWEQDGRPEGRSFEYWLKAKEMHLRQMAYDRWLAEGTPIGRAEEIWRDVAEEIESNDP
ncbi:MAG: hypothetical protein JWR39_1466 [Devosia sp.]|jgi:hypothetical protein|nr:hypothetical protein [Devosia sp.]